MNSIGVMANPSNAIVAATGTRQRRERVSASAASCSAALAAQNLALVGRLGSGEASFCRSAGGVCYLAVAAVAVPILTIIAYLFTSSEISQHSIAVANAAELHASRQKFIRPVATVDPRPVAQLVL
jgi:lysylphosphatidylglycerol synthetase-like protein (DUF2156 family)